MSKNREAGKDEMWQLQGSHSLKLSLDTGPVVKLNWKFALHDIAIVWHGIAIGGGGPCSAMCNCTGKLYCNVLKFALYDIAIV